MTMRPCKQCGNPVGKTAENCPQCATPHPYQFTAAEYLLAVAIPAFTALVIVLFVCLVQAD